MNPSTRNDFDFLLGRWHVDHRRLVARLAGNNDWQAFDGTSVTQSILGGMGLVDDNVLNLPSGSYRAAGLRAFNDETRQWAIWWLDARNPHTIDVPVVGGFDGDVGTFVADETFNGKPIRVRFRWTHTRTGAPRWEQAFSPDAGKTWEVNWSMQFSRAG
jgi:hypothetical protein